MESHTMLLRESGIPGEMPLFVRGLLEKAGHSLLVRHEVNLLRTWAASGYTEMTVPQALWMLQCFIGEERSGQHMLARDVLRQILPQLDAMQKERIRTLAQERGDTECQLLLEESASAPVYAASAMTQMSHA